MALKTCPQQLKHPCHAEITMTIERDNEPVQVKASWNGSSKTLVITENGVPVESNYDNQGLLTFISILTTFNI
jgi:hypothetical protein